AGQVSPSKSQPSPTPAPEVVDPLGRETPRGTITGFTQAVHHEDFVTAAAFMQMTGRQRRDAETLTRRLTALLDRYFTRPIATLSASPAGVPNDGLPLDQERIVLSLPDKTEDILLKRITDKQAGPIWLISSETLSKVPAWGWSEEASWADRNLPEWLV